MSSSCAWYKIRKLIFHVGSPTYDTGHIQTLLTCYTRLGPRLHSARIVCVKLKCKAAYTERPLSPLAWGSLRLAPITYLARSDHLEHIDRTRLRMAEREPLSQLYEKLERLPLDVPTPPWEAGVYPHFCTEATQDLTEAIRPFQFDVLFHE